MSLESGLILILATLIITLDFKMWAKIDRVVRLALMERQDIIEAINKISRKIEEIECRLREMR